MKKDNRIWKGNQSLNILIWAILILIPSMILVFKYNFSDLLLLIAIPIWLIISCVVDYKLKLTNYEE